MRKSRIAQMGTPNKHSNAETENIQSVKVKKKRKLEKHRGPVLYIQQLISDQLLYSDNDPME